MDNKAEVQQARQLLDRAEMESRCPEQVNEIKRRLETLSDEARYSKREKLYFILAVVGLAAAVVASFTATMAAALVLFGVAVLIGIMGFVQHSLRIKLTLLGLHQANQALQKCLEKV